MPNLLTPEQELIIKDPTGFAVNKPKAKEVVTDDVKPTDDVKTDDVIVPPVTPATEAKIDPPVFKADDLSDDELAELLAKRGKKVVSASDPVMSEKEKKDKRESEKLKYALDQKIFNRERYEDFLVAKRQPARSIVFAQYMEDHKDGGKTREQLESDFRKLYYEDVDDDHTYLAEARRKDMDREAASILKSSYPEMYSLDKKFDEHETTQATQQRQQTEAQQKAVQYAQDVESIFSSINKTQLKVKEDDENEESFDYDYPATLIQELKADFLTEKRLASLSGLPKDALHDIVQTALLKLSQGQAISFAAKSYHSKKMSANASKRKNMQPDETVSGSDVVERDEQAYNMVKDHLPDVRKEAGVA